MKPILIMWSTLVIFLVACSIPQLPPPPTMLERVDLANKKWDELGIKNYHIVIQFYESFATGLTSKLDVTVRDNHVVNSSCEANECPAFDLANVYTVDDLFKIARGSTIASMHEEYVDCVQKLAFDQTYGFPTSMDIDCPRSADEEQSFDVISFEVLK